MINLKYPFEVHPLAPDDGGGWLVTFPDLPGCMADGETIDKALHEAEDAVKSWIKTSKTLNLPIPKQKEDKHLSGRFLQRVPKTMHARLLSRAKQEGVSINTLVIALLAEGLGKETRKTK